MHMPESNTEIRVEDIDIAWEMAYAEKPGRDYLHDSPNLSREELIAVAYEIGGAAMHAERTLTGRTDDYLKDYLALYVGYVPYEYRSVPPKPKELPKLKESPLIAEWAVIPGLKLINGRPVADREDMRNFGNRQITNGAATYKKGWGARVWDTLHGGVKDTMDYVPEAPEYAMKQALDIVQYFDAEAAESAGLEGDEHVDLYSLYEALPVLRHLVEGNAKRPLWFNGFGTSSVSFLESFLAETLHLEELPPPNDSLDRGDV